MQQQIKQKWGLFILGIAIAILGVILFCKSVLQLHLRNTPRIFLTWLGVAAGCAFLAWANIQAGHVWKSKKSVWTARLLNGIRFTSVLLSLALMLVALISGMMTFRPEHEVQENGVRMLARVNAFLDVYVDYYEYHGFLFYGKKLGSEYYGGGGYDPFERQEKPVPRQRSFTDSSFNHIGSKYLETAPPENTETLPNQEVTAGRLNLQVVENRSGEFVFDISINDFIECYNSLCGDSQDNVFLGPVSDWKSRIYESGIHSDYETIVYLFSEDEAIHSLPTVTAYTPSDCDAIQEITVDFDDHGYSESLFEQYKKMCFYTVKTFFPEMPDAQITKLCATLNTLANENLFSEEEWFGHDAVPPALFYKDGIGVYPYFAVGQCSHLCIVPVTKEMITHFEMKGVGIYEIE